MPFVSVIMASRNTSNYIETAIESVLAQTFKNFELIIVDDNSDDNSIKIINKYKKKDKRIKLIRNSKTLGPAKSRNIALNVSRGKWISILDSDDVYFPNKLKKQVEIIENDTEIIFVGSGLVFIDENGKNLSNYNYSSKNSVLKRNILKIGAFPPHSSYFIKSRYLKKINGYNPRYHMAQDYDLLLRLLKLGKFFSADETLIKLRLHSKNRSLKKFNSLSQLDYAICANICHYIRTKTNSDPGTDLNSNEWSIFLKQITSTLKDDQYYKYLVFKKQLKVKIKKLLLKNQIKSLFNLFFKEKLYFYFLVDYFRGHSISNKLKNYYLKYYINYFFKNKTLFKKKK
jgi:glycosyltransferase involved in cell wall biosynthesis